MRQCTNLEEIGFDRYCCQITGEIILDSEIDEHCDEYSCDDYTDLSLPELAGYDFEDEEQFDDGFNWELDY